MLFKLSLRNIRRNLRNYAIYFFTLVLATTIFYLFNSLESQTIMLNVTARQHEIIGLMNQVMSILSVGVAVVLGLLIIYASRFLMKRRKTEFGIYMTLGMGKGQISRILLVETLIIGLISLAVGLGVGIGLSQLMSVFVASLFESDMSSFRFIFSSAAFLKTIALFGGIYLIVMVFNAISVGRTKLIKLIHNDKINEKVKFRNPIFCTILFIAAVALLVRAYTGVTTEFDLLTDQKIAQYITFGIAGTFMLFWSLSGLAIRIAQKFKGFYNRGLNTFVLRELNGKINTTVISMSVISLLLFLTIVIFSSATSIRNSMTAELHTYAPADFQVTKTTWQDDPHESTGLLTAEQALTALNIDLDDTFQDYVAAKTYYIKDLTYAQTVGREALESVEQLTGQTVDNMLQMHEHVIHISDYNRLANLYNRPTLSLSNDEYAIIANFKTAVQVRNYALAHSSPQVTLNGQTLKPKSGEVVDGFIYMNSQPTNEGFIIIPDNIDISSDPAESFLIGNYRAETKALKQDIDAMLYSAIYPENTSDSATLDPNPGYITTNTYSLNPQSKINIYDDSIGLSAMATFVGLYLGSVFLVTSATLLALKEVSESSDNQEKYLILSKLGVEQKSLNRTLLTQIGIFFGLPLFIAIIHSIFGIIFADKIIVTFAEANLLQPIITTSIFIIAIYGGYFLLTYFMSKRIVLTLAPSRRL